MRILAGTLLVTVCIFVFSFYSISILERTASELVDLLQQMEESVLAGKWQEAELDLENFSREWQRRHFVWAMLVEHTEIDNIDVRLAYLRAFVKNRSLPDAQAEINALFTYLKHIPETEKLTVQNLL